MTIKIKNTFSDKILTSDDNIKNIKEYPIIMNVITEIIESGFPYIANNYCISSTNILHTALKHQGINSKIVECQLTLTYTDITPPKIVLVGYDDIKNENEIDTHVVLITETSTPIIIDSSIQFRLTNDKAILLDSVKNNLVNQLSNHLGTYYYHDHHIIATYEQKPNQKVPMLHQHSIIDRINTDKKIFESIDLLKKLNYIGIGLSVFAVIAVINQFLHFYQ